MSLTNDHGTLDLMAINGLSTGVPAQTAVDPAEANGILRMFPLKCPENISAPVPIPTPEDVRIFRVTPRIVPVLDHSKGFGHTEPVTC